MKRFILLTRCIGLTLLLSTHMAEAAGGAGNAWRFPPEPNPMGVVIIPNGPTSLNLYPFTVTFWMQSTQAPSFQSVSLVNKASEPYNGWQVITTNGEVRASFAANFGNYVAPNTAPGMSGDGLNGGPVHDGAWHHVAFTVDAMGGKLYVDGVLKDARPWTGFPSAPSTFIELRIGRSFDFMFGRYDGMLEEITIWDVALNPQQILTNMNRSLTGLEQGLVAYYRCNETNGNMMFDSAAYGGDQHGQGVVQFVPSTLRPFTPYVETEFATFTGTNTASLSGVVNTMGTNTWVRFEWGVSTNCCGQNTNFENATPWQFLPDLPMDFHFGQTLSNLNAGTNYHFRAVASNSFGVAAGVVQQFILPSPPILATLPASGVRSNAATLNASVSSGGPFSTYAWFEWGTTTNYGNATPGQFLAGPPIIFSREITGLPSLATYHFRVVATNIHGRSYGSNQVFATPAVGTPAATTEPAAQVTIETARLNGVVNANGANTLAWFDWGTTTNYGSQEFVTAGTFTTNRPYFEDLTLLPGNTTIHFRAGASNVHGMGWGSNRTFTTLPAALPSVSTLAANPIGIENAFLNGTLNPNGSTSWAWFEWGLTTNYGNVSSGRAGSSSTNTTTYGSSIAGLQASTTYHFRAIGSNSAGVVYGSNQTFTTMTPQPASITTLPATAVSGLAAQLNGTVNARGSSTRTWFEYGKTTNYGLLTPSQSFLATTNSSNFNATVTALEANSTYYFRAVASNVAGISYGTNLTFAVGDSIAGPDFEPNDSALYATPLLTAQGKVTAHLFPQGDVDFYSFRAQAGDRVYAAVMNNFSPANGNAELSVIDADGFTILEADSDNGTIDNSAPSIAGTVIPGSGTYYLRVHAAGTGIIFDYDLWFRVASGTPAPETEPNDGYPGEPLGATRWFTGAISTQVDVDFYSVTLEAGDSVFLSLDLDPERDGVEWNGQVGFGLFGHPLSMVQIDDAGNTGPDSEALFFTVKEAGTYGIRVMTSGSASGTYHLSVAVLPAATRPAKTYTSGSMPLALPQGFGVTNFSLNIPDNKRIGKLQVILNANVQTVQQIDASLTSPNGNTVGLFTAIGAPQSGIQTNLSLVLDDDAALPINMFPYLSNVVVKPERDFRLRWFAGEQAQGTWTLTLRQRNTANSGALLGWGLVVHEALPPLGSAAVVYSNDFEANDGGFTHSGVQDEWQRGTPSFGVITNAHSGVSCWKTDLTGTYNDRATNDLYSPNINLANISQAHQIVLSWAMKYQFESAAFERAFVQVQEVGGSKVRTIWSWLGDTMEEPQGSPSVNVQEAAGWGIQRSMINDFAGKTIRVRFHFASDSTVQFAGWAIDDVSVTAYPAIVKTGADIGLNLGEIPGRLNQLEYATDLINWQPLSPPVRFSGAEGDVFSFVDTNPPNAMRFYRVAPVR